MQNQGIKQIGLLLRLFSLLLALPLPVHAQAPGAAELTVEEIIRLDTNLVVLDVQVLSRKTGENITGLKPADFELYEDGQKQEISHFSHDKLSLSIVLLMDISGSVSPVLKEIQAGALLALERLKEADEIALIAFSSETQLVQDFTHDRRLIIDKIGSIEKSPAIGQGTSLFDGLRTAALHMNKAGNPSSRRVIITITDNVAWEYHFSGLSEQEVLEQVIDSGSMVCGLVVAGAISKTERLFQSGRSQKDIFRRQMSIDPFANQTGGEVLNATRVDINSRLALLVDHLRTRYSLGFAPRRERADGKYHRLSLSLRADVRKQLGDVVVRARQGYLARPKK
jgi:VWFA-related protein